MIIKEIFATLALLILYSLYRISHFFILTRRIDTFTDWINTDRRDDIGVILFFVITFFLVLFFGFFITFLIYLIFFVFNLLLVFIKRIIKL